MRPVNRLGPAVRLLGVVTGLRAGLGAVCRLWFPGAEVVLSQVVEWRPLWPAAWTAPPPATPLPVLLTCPLPRPDWGRVPASVSLSGPGCPATLTNNLRVVYNTPPRGKTKKKFAVCVKGLDFPNTDLSVRLVEWLELLSILGVDKIFLYNLAVHPNVTKVLSHYTARGLVDLAPLSLPDHLPNQAQLRHTFLAGSRTVKRQQELVPYNDCLYRNMYRYQYIGLFDVGTCQILRHSLTKTKNNC